MSDLNYQLELANHFILETGMNVFLTGKAGTGKTTFLKNLKLKSPKRMIVLAPTGVAAINAGGVTIHSFFQLAFAPFLPVENQSGQQPSKRFDNKFNKEKINIIRSLDLLVIDEISMVRADLLDAIDASLRKYRNRYKPFGGVQLLLIGDVQQLAPVVRDEEWQMLRKYYASPYFFHSHALMESQYLTIELQKIYRQSDPSFVSILNAVRENRLTDSILQLLNKRYMPDFEPDEKDGYITLTTHNSQAQAINQDKLARIHEKEFAFNAVIEGSFPEYSFPTEEHLVLKKGAQVMFVKNDPSPEKRFFNGKIGFIKSITQNCIMVECDNQIITVEQQQWTNAKYALDPKSQEIVELIEGTFTQYPLKPAWAITIHKSQGLTFDRAIINAGHAFSHGQVYVALSRCRSLEGMVLSTPIRSNGVISDPTVLSFNRYMEEHKPNDTILEEARLQYFLDIANELFDFKGAIYSMQHICRILEEHLSKVYPDKIKRLKESLLNADIHILQVGFRFHNQLALLTQEWKNPEQNEVIQERMQKAVIYFSDKANLYIQPILKDGIPETDNKEVEKQLEKEYQQLHEFMQLKFACLVASADHFSVGNYLHTKALKTLALTKFKKSASSRPTKVEISSDIQHPELYERLRKWRFDRADELNIPVYTILHQKALLGLANRMPTNRSELLAIPGIGKRIVEKFGKDIIAIIDDYRADRGEMIELTK